MYNDLFDDVMNGRNALQGENSNHLFNVYRNWVKGSRIFDNENLLRSDVKPHCIQAPCNSQ
jgi:hypothetical protein